jgi:hypothetical protein
MEKRMKTIAAPDPLVLFRIELPHLPSQVHQRERANDVHEQVGVARIGNQLEGMNGMATASEPMYTPIS